MDDLLSEFLAETAETLSAIDAGLVALERDPADGQALATVFRLVHTIKGTCGFLGLARLEAIAHASESLLGRFRDGGLAVTPAAVGLVLASVDAIRRLLPALEQRGSEPPGDDSALIRAIDALAAGRIPGPPAAATASTMAVDDDPADLPAAAAATGSGRSAAASIRVGIEALDRLMALAGELVLTRNQLLELAGRPGDGPFAVALQRLSRITGDLQDGVMRTRLQPVGHVWATLPRLVRDLARKAGKTIELRLDGAETLLDRHVLEAVKDPLMHMVRNSADHGIGRPGDRRRQGKPEVGTVTLGARHEDGHAVIEVGDDGDGLATDAIRARALAGGLATADALDAMTDAEIHAFVFRPGFSTVERVTSVSGRGVGLDVVRTNIERIGGTVEVRSAPGVGATFTIRIPLTLSVVPALIVRAGGLRFALPQSPVVEVVRADGSAQARIERVNGGAVLRLRDRLVSLVDLGALLGIDAASPAAEPLVVVLAGPRGRQFGVIVDVVSASREIVVESLPPVIRSIPCYAASTILGDGGVVMILDPDGLAGAIGIGAGAAEAAAIPAPPPETMARLLFEAGGPAPVAVRPTVSTARSPAH